MNSLTREIVVSLLVFTVLLTVKVEAQSLEQQVVADMKALGYNIEKTDDGGGYNVTVNGGLYDDNTLWFYLSIYKRGVNEFVSVIAPIVMIDEVDTVGIAKTSSRLIARNVYILCADYGSYFSEEKCYFNLARTIESSCYSRGLIGDIMACMKSELQEQASNARGYQLNKSEIEDVNKMHQALIKSNRVKANRGMK